MYTGIRVSCVGYIIIVLETKSKSGSSLQDIALLQLTTLRFIGTISPSDYTIHTSFFMI